MSKIKDIDISDFRIYQGLQKFSFESSAGLSNLMVIYAPNGFGKTSFFDAIEWCFSNKIRRFETEYLYEEIERKEYSDGDKILLTNRKTYKTGKKGTVSINTADNKKITRVAKVRKITNSNFKHDYRPGSDLQSDINESLLPNLINTNILTQDQIDAFLRYTRPEDKFTALQEFWPEGKSATDTLKKLDSFQTMTNLEINELNKKIEGYTTSINALLNSIGNVDAVNTAIAAIGHDALSGFKIEPLSGTIDDELYNAVLEVTQGSVKRAVGLQEIAKIHLGRLQQLKSGFDAYNQSVQGSEKAQEELSQLNVLAKLYVDRQTAQKILLSAEQVVLDSKLLAEKYARLLEIYPRFVSLVRDVAIQQIIIADFYKINQQLIEQTEIFNRRLGGLSSKEEELSESIESLKETMINWDNNFSSYKYWLEEEKQQSAELTKLNEQTKVLDARISFQTIRKRYLVNLSETLSFDDLHDNDRLDLLKELTEYKLVAGQIDEVTKLIALRDTEIERSTSLDESLNRLLSWGEDYITQTNADHCPLCATKFADTTALVNAIYQQKAAGINAAAALLEDVNSLKKREIALKVQQTIVISNIRDFFRAEINECDSLIGLEQQNKDQVSNLVKDTGNTIDHAKNSVNRFLGLLIPNHDHYVHTLDLDQLKTDLEHVLTNAQKKLNRQKTLIKTQEVLINQKNQSINLNLVKINAAENAISLSRNDSHYTEGQRLMDELKLMRDSLTNSELKAFVTKTQRALTEAEKKVLESRNTLQDVQQLLNNSSVRPVSEIELPGLQLSKQNEKGNHDKLIANYLSIFNAALPDVKPELEPVKQAIEIQSDLLNKIDAELTALTELSIKLELIEQNVIKTRMEKELAEEVVKLDPLMAVSKELEVAKQTAKEYIDREINNYFNQDVINQIYSRIEPHPDLNMIDFNPQVTDKGPILNVQAVSKEEKLNPVLYLSAGQLNVLSLSIFLAKAFEVGNEVISTIFMDDPIQNLSDINVLSFIDLIRTMITNYDRQIVISTHDESFYKLMRHKMPSDAFNVIYYEMQTFGKATQVN